MDTRSRDAAAPLPASPRPEPPLLSVIVPAHRCAGMLRRCLAGLLASDLPRDRWELIVVDDGSGDDTPDVARLHADQTIATPNGPRGPGYARNLGAVRARGALLVFVDSDVVVAPDVLSRFRQLFTSSSVDAAFGAYDTAPADPGFVSQYRNLLHHYVHLTNAGPATTFWAGCGAVRAAAFAAVDGFDAEAYPRPQIEDIDLGYRLTAQGYRVVLDPTIQGKHLKRWTLGGMLRTDLRDRAIPWMHLLIERGDAPSVDGPLNLAMREKVLTAITGLACLTPLIALSTADRRWLLLGTVLLLVVVLGNLSLLAWFARVRGVMFALGVVPLRLLFYVTSGVGGAWAMLTHRLQPGRRPIAPLRADSHRAMA